ncbi:Holliday junction endonuclease RuvC [Desulfonauticus submarinus]|uniref:Crossover junction endodeoxyribonuclease RuvC n=1 Tax=Desulfonauticus submarinus TaxID=206665 RepID=A0A1H0GHI6_9BACT|nr:crossover junction endodeoxyribonuclease RuvC [Desulfonauticus submarinus]SDO06360.1 Holliday junction endonuclease RuvC [Desulfonauticus submarinus]
MLILGLDPGSRCMGIGLIEEQEAGLRLILAKAIYPPKGNDLGEKLGFIFKELVELIDTFQPKEVAIEDVFFATNARSALKLGQVRGAAVAACAWKNIPVFSYEPTKVKQSVVGVGRASKEQVSFMVKQILKVKDNWPLDVSDALAVAIAHLNTRRFNKMVQSK